MRILTIMFSCFLLHSCQYREASKQTIDPSEKTPDTSQTKVKTKSDQIADTIQFNSIGDSIYYSAPSVSVINGKLTRKLFYGPPGFGMNPKEDAHYTWFVIVLNKPITFIPNPKSQFNSDYTGQDKIEGIDWIQIREQRDNLKLLSRVGKKVRVKGQLNVCVVPSENGKVILEYIDVE